MKYTSYITKLALVAGFIIISFASFAQKPWIRNQENYDENLLHFGFSLGINSTGFRIQHTPDFKLLDSIYIVESRPQSGLNLGIISNLRLGPYFDLRFVPALSFASRVLDYTFHDSTAVLPVISKKVESTFIELPLLLKYKSERYHNYRFYVLGGGKYSIDLVSQAKVKEDDKQLVKLINNDYGYEIGVGMDIYFELFKFSPEIKLYNGLNNLLVKEESAFSSPIDKMFSRTVLVTFNFE